MSEDKIEFERDLSREQIAERLENFASYLRGGGPCNVDVGGEEMTIDPPDIVEFEVSVEDEKEIVGDEVERSLTFELLWATQEDADDVPIE